MRITADKVRTATMHPDITAEARRAVYMATDDEIERAIDAAIEDTGGIDADEVVEETITILTAEHEE